MEINTTTNQDLICKNIKRLPWELKYAIYNCIDIDTRLEILQAKQTELIVTLYRAFNEKILNVSNLMQILDNGLRFHIFYKDKNGTFLTQPPLKKLLPDIKYSINSTAFSEKHPLFNMLLKNVHLTLYNYQLTSRLTIVRREALDQIMVKIRSCFDILPTLFSGKKRFDYSIRKIIFRFTHILSIFAFKFKEQIKNKEIKILEQNHKKFFKKNIAKRIPICYRKIQRSLIKKEKLAEKEAKKKVKKHSKLIEEDCKKIIIIKRIKR